MNATEIDDTENNRRKSDDFICNSLRNLEYIMKTIADNLSRESSRVDHLENNLNSHQQECHGFRTEIRNDIANSRTATAVLSSKLDEISTNIHVIHNRMWTQLVAVIGGLVAIVMGLSGIIFAGIKFMGH